MWNGRRVSTNDAYLEPARERPTLTIMGDVLVDRVECVGSRVTGVRVHTGSGGTVVHGRTVVLCARAIHSPAMLMRSGIGPADALRAIGITPLVDAPGVGQNLGEHASITLDLQLRPEAWASAVDVRPIRCLVRYSSRLVGAGRNDMQLFSVNPAGIDEAARGRGALRASVVQTFSKGRVRITTPEAPMPLVAVDTASKMAIEGFTTSLAFELEAFNVRVKLVEPGYGPSTRFTQNTGSRLEGLIPEAYAPFAQFVFAALTQPAAVTNASDVAEAVWRAANDASGQLRFPAGADAVALAQSR